MSQRSRFSLFASTLSLFLTSSMAYNAPLKPSSFDPGAQGVALMRPISIRDTRNRELKKGFDALYAQALTPASKLVVLAPKSKQVMVLYPTLGSDRHSIRSIDIMSDADWKIQFVGSAGGEEVSLKSATKFITARGLKLGDSAKAVRKALGQPLEVEGEPETSAQWTYILTSADLEKSPLKEFKALEYKASYEFRKGKLTRMTFGFSTP